MPTPIQFSAGKVILKGVLNDSPTGQALAARLPLAFRMSRWGDEYYGGIGKPLGASAAPDAREDMELGELAYWLPANALCLFFGPTPMSTGPQPRAASPVSPVGKLEGDLAALKALGGSIQVKVERAAEK